MHIKNRYFIIDLPNPNMLQIYDIVVGDTTTQRTSLDGTKIMVKLPEGDDTNYGILQNATEYTHEEIIIELAKPEWSKQEDWPA